MIWDINIGIQILYNFHSSHSHKLFYFKYTTSLQMAFLHKVRPSKVVNEVPCLLNRTVYTAIHYISQIKGNVQYLLYEK